MHIGRSGRAHLWAAVGLICQQKHCMHAYPGGVAHPMTPAQGTESVCSSSNASDR